MRVQNSLSEVQITPIKPINGLVGFASFVLNNNLYLSGVGIYTKPTGGWRLVYPTRGKTGLNVFHPINRLLAQEIEHVVTTKFQEIVVSE
jgi:stage V sporulation protein G